MFSLPLWMFQYTIGVSDSSARQSEARRLTMGRKRRNGIARHNAATAQLQRKSIGKYDIMGYWLCRRLLDACVARRNNNNRIVAAILYVLVRLYPVECCDKEREREREWTKWKPVFSCIYPSIRDFLCAAFCLCSFFHSVHFRNVRWMVYILLLVRDWPKLNCSMNNNGCGWIRGIFKYTFSLCPQ